MRIWDDLLRSFFLNYIKMVEMPGTPHLSASIATPPPTIQHKWWMFVGLTDQILHSAEVGLFKKALPSRFLRILSFIACWFPNVTFYRPTVSWLQHLLVFFCFFKILFHFFLLLFPLKTLQLWLNSWRNK